VSGFEHATFGTIVLLLAMVAPVLYYIRRAGQGKQMYVRRLAGVDAVDEAIGRAAELGRPVSFSTGLTGVGPTLYAVLGVLYYVSRKIAQLKSQMIVPQNDPEVLAVVEDTLRDAYRDEGRPHLFDQGSLRFLSSEQLAFAAGYMGIVQRENVASAFLLGSFAAEALLLAEAGQQVGAMQVAGSISPEQVPFFICTCDYTLIGEELFAASAYLTHEPVQLGSLYGQDRAKMIFFVLIILGVTIATINSVWSLSIPNIDTFLAAELW
jgi:hypothetical protein